MWWASLRYRDPTDLHMAGKELQLVGYERRPIENDKATFGPAGEDWPSGLFGVGIHDSQVGEPLFYVTLPDSDVKVHTGNSLTVDLSSVLLPEPTLRQRVRDARHSAMR